MMMATSRSRSTRRLAHSKQAGIVLVSAMLLLVVLTIMSVCMFRSFGIQEKIAGNVREKQRALQAAISSQSYGEWWLVNGSYAPAAIGLGSAPLADVSCNSLVDANLGTGLTAGQICNNTLASAIGVAPSKWPSSGNDYGIAYTPPDMNIPGSVVNTSVNDVYYKRPRIYIYDMGALSTGRGEVYQIDAYGYGLTSTAVAVVESTLTISCNVCNQGGL